MRDMVFIPQVLKPAATAAAASSARRCQRQGTGGNWGLAIVVGVLGAALGPVFAALLGGIHGDLAAGLVLLALGSAGVGFGIGRAIGRQN